MNLSDCFLPGEILLPKTADPERWSVIACDQFTSDPDYWARVESFVGDAPSTLRLMLPEAWLDRPDRPELEEACTDPLNALLTGYAMPEAYAPLLQILLKILQSTPVPVKL